MDFGDRIALVRKQKKLSQGELGKLADVSGDIVGKYERNEINVDTVIVNAKIFLSRYPLGTNPRGNARQEALGLKDMLDAYNNQGD